MDISEEDQENKPLLRKRAEEALRGKPVELDGLSSADIQFLLHELQVYQAELNIQNEELRLIQQDLESSRDLFSDLYNFAPIGYCTISRKDTIQEANQTLAALLGVEHKQLINVRFSRFVAPEDQDKFYLHRQRAFLKRQHLASEIQLVKQTGERFYVRLESRIAHGHEDRLLMMVIDITLQRELQNRLIEQREQERHKIAHDLHDGPVQALAAIIFDLRGIVIDHPDPELVRALEAIQDRIREQVQVLRNYAVDLRPPIISQLGLEKGLRSYLEGFQGKNPGLLVRLDIQPGKINLPETTTVALFRICQEALTNILKHTFDSATEVIVRIHKEGHLFRLEIEDNGSGFSLPDQWLDFAKEGHLGILGMRERAEAIGGNLEIRAAPGRGTHLIVTVPNNSTKS